MDLSDEGYDCEDTEKRFKERQRKRNTKRGINVERWISMISK